MRSDDAEPLVSIVVVAVHNVENYLEQCIESMVGQTHHNLEVILVDDGSFDRSGQICDVWASEERRVMVIHQHNSGVGSARNSGLPEAGGDFIVFVDADDWLMPSALETMWKNMRAEGADVSRIGTLIVGLYLQYSGQVAGTYLVMNCPSTFEFLGLPGYLDVVVWGKRYRSGLLCGVIFPAGRAEDLPVTYAVMKRATRVVLDLTSLWCYRQPGESVGHRAVAASHEPTDCTFEMLEGVRKDCTENEPYATWMYMQCAVLNYQLIVQRPSRAWTLLEREFAAYVECLPRAKESYVQHTVSTEPLAKFRRTQRIRWWMIGYVLWLFWPLNGTCVRVSRSHES